MAITTYTELQSAISNELEGRTDLTSRITEFIALAEDDIALDTRIRTRAQETQGLLIWKADVAVEASEVGGTANAITFTPATAATEYAYADSYTFVAEDTNTAAVTVNISSLGSRDVEKIYGGTKEALAANDIREGGSYRLYYDGSDFLVSPQAGALIPSNFLGIRANRLDSSSSKRMNFLSPHSFWQQAEQLSTGTPRMFTIEGDWALAGPKPDSTVQHQLDYWRRFTAFATGTDTNWLLTNARGLYLFRSLIHAANFIGEEDAAIKWAAMYDDIADNLKKANEFQQYPAGSYIRPSGSTP